MDGRKSKEQRKKEKTSKERGEEGKFKRKRFPQLTSLIIFFSV